MLFVCGQYSCNQLADYLFRDSTTTGNFSPATSDLFPVREENMRTLIAWCGTNAIVLHCLAHNHITRQKILYDVPLLSEILPTLFVMMGTRPAREKVEVCAGPLHLRSLWVNKWRVKQRLHSFFFPLASLPPFFFFGWAQLLHPDERAGIAIQDEHSTGSLFG